MYALSFILIITPFPNVSVASHKSPRSDWKNQGVVVYAKTPKETLALVLCRVQTRGDYSDLTAIQIL